MAYATADIDAIIAKLEASLALGTAEVQFEGRKLVYRSVADIRSAITYFRSLYNNATDAPADAPQSVRTYFGYSNNGFRGF